MNRKICISVGNTELDRIYADIDYAKTVNAGFVELRFDTIKETKETQDVDEFHRTPVFEKIEKIISYGKALGIKIIGTKRGAGFGPGRNISSLKEIACEEFQRIKFLKYLIEAGIYACDIELDIVRRPAVKDFTVYAHDMGSKVILSVHDFSKQIDLMSTVRFYIDAHYFGADCFKLADVVISDKDVTAVLEKNQTVQSIRAAAPVSFPAFTIFGMGEKGTATRILSLIYGSEMAYCSSQSGATAPGQVSAEEFYAMMNFAEVQF